MNTLRSPHPARKQLEAFGVGRLPADECAAIEAHVAECDECCAVLLGVADDTIVRLAKESTTKAFEPVKTSTSPNETPAELRDHPRYRVLGLVGVGGMGAVYKAEHRLMERLVALKVIHGEFLQNRQAVERFTREVKAAARLAHSNIVTAFDAEHEGDLHFLVMEFVEGVSLDRYVAHQGPLSAPATVRLIRQAAAGLDHAHQRGMVHRDIKPHNLMVKRTGELKILDFGLARFATGNDAAGNDDIDSDANGADEAQGLVERAGATRSDDERQRQRTIAYQPTSAGMILGTPDYLAPEQARDARSADIRSDIY
ncbi:MAG TPA: serine/threonine-protein kinase, partial [Pirellulaceae bacterium]|nr:serine/threonine-protein kinase [Pirellulaceae bacterium]